MSDHRLLTRTIAVSAATVLATLSLPFALAFAEPSTTTAITPVVTDGTTEASTEAATTATNESPAEATAPSDAATTAATTATATGNAATTATATASEAPAEELTAQSVTSAQLPTGSFFLSSGVGNDLVIELAGGATSIGTNVWCYGANDTVAQQWKAVPHYDGTTIEYYVIQSVKDPTKVLDVDGGVASNGRNVDVWTENGSMAQRWWAEKSGTGFIMHSMVGDGMTYVLDVTGGFTANGTNLEIWSANGSAAQLFTTHDVLAAPEECDGTEITAGTYTMRSDNLYASVPGKSSAIVPLVGNGSATGDSGQTFTIKYEAAAGYYTIATQCASRLVEPSGGNPLPGATVVQEGSIIDGKNYRYWSITKVSGGGYSIVNAQTGSTLSFSGTSLVTDPEPGATWTLDEAATPWTSDGIKEIARNTPNNKKITSGTFVIESKKALDKVFDIHGGSKSDGGNLQLFSSNMTAAQTYVVALAKDDDGAGMVTITCANSNKVIDVTGGKAASGTNVQQWASNNSDAQHWYILENADGSYSIWSALGREQVIEAAGGGISAGTNIQTYQSNGTDAQEWLFNDTTSFPAYTGTGNEVSETGYRTIESAASANAIFDVAGGSTASGTKVQLWGANGTPAQGYELVEVPQTDGSKLYRIVNLNSGKCLGVANGDKLAGASVDQEDLSTGSKSQLWAFVKSGSTYAIISADTGYAIDAGGATSGTELAMASYDPMRQAQQWNLGAWSPSLSEGCYTIVTNLNSKVIEVAGGSCAEDANVQTWTSNATPGQRWYIRRVSGDSYTIQNVISGRYMHATGTTSGSNVVLSSDAGSTLSAWNLDYEPGYGYVFVNAAAKNAGVTLALDIVGASSGDGARAQVYKHSSNDNVAEGFKLQSSELISSGWYEFAPRCAVDKRLDSAGGFFNAGANVQIWDGNGSGAQAWYVYSIGDGWYTMECNGKGLNLDVDGGGGAGSNVHVWYNSNGGYAAQHWRFQMSDTGLEIVSQCGGVLDVSGAGSSNGTNVGTWDANGSWAQAWNAYPSTQKWSRYDELQLRIDRYCNWATMIANDDSHGFSELCHYSGPDYDCSGLVIASLWQAGINTNGAYSTFDMANCLCAAGWQKVWFYAGWEGSLQRGDVLVKEDQHCTVYIGNGLAVAAHESEPGTEWNDRCWGAYGDQDGHEIAVDVLDPYWGWNYYLRPTIWSQWY